MKIRVSPKEGFTLIELLVVISIIAILAGIALPAFTGVIERGNQTKVLSNAKQIYLGMKMFAGDFDGLFPSKAPDATAGLNAGTTAANANDAYRNLVPNYVPTEKVFWQPKDGFCKDSPPADIHTPITGILAAGTNHFAYVKGLNDTSPPSWPLIAEGFATEATGSYSATPGAKGGLWKGKAAIVIRVDGSGKSEILTPAFQVFDYTGTTNKANIFTPVAASGSSNGWLSSLSTADILNPNPATP